MKTMLRATVANRKSRGNTMTKEIRLNAFAMNCVAHQSPGLWTHPRDRTAEYNRLPYWLDLARALERGRFDGAVPGRRARRLRRLSATARMLRSKRDADAGRTSRCS